MICEYKSMSSYGRLVNVTTISIFISNLYYYNILVFNFKHKSEILCKYILYYFSDDIFYILPTYNNVILLCNLLTR